MRGNKVCGIAVVVDRELVPQNDDRATARDNELTRMLEMIRHRGDADHFGERGSGAGFSMGTNRLAIVDRTHAAQPLSDEAGQVWLVFSGELYGFRDIRQELEQLGHTFRTDSDTEVVLRSYLEWGIPFLRKLNGMFAFVICDSRDGSFLAVRDHVGIKPLYYQLQDGVYRFASEQKCLLNHPALIRPVPPGTYVQNGEEVRYFELDEPQVSTTSSAASRRYRELFEAAVRKQVDTDLPLAVPFSGGIDSAAVLQAARRYHHDVTAFTVGFEGAADVEVARRYCEDFGVKQHIVYLKPSDLIDIIPRIVHGAELFEVVDIIDACTQFLVYQAVRRRGIKVAICGDGADEVLAGYDLFKTHADPVGLMKYRVGNLHRTDLQRVDRSSMLNSVEARVPFLDRHLLEFAYSLPMDLKIRDGVEKWVLREAMRDRLPAYIVDRPKIRMPDGSGIKNVVIDHARQHVDVDDRVARGLGITSTEGAYFLDIFLKAGFPPPTERFKRPVDDYAPNGYFEFIS
ncbi:asparagine synthetase B [Micromonospora craniellae]|uniref:asparagine synthase (glutamine-hydrolyzing) n=1 Tax=Micromonospora craniellae TaxID=2294034 RepID=A0A372FSX1_9ACTN|nr:asparagine synthetase B [Micromonospora craniellae]